MQDKINKQKNRENKQKIHNKEKSPLCIGQLYPSMWTAWECG